MSLFLRSRRFWFGFSVFILGLSLSRLGDFVIPFVYPERVINPDAAFLLFPQIKIFSYVADAASSLVYFIFFGLAFRTRDRSLPLYLVGLGLLYGLRGLMLPLTPLGNPLGEDYHYGVSWVTGMYGFFPSGHTGSAFLMYLLVDRVRFYRAKWILGLLVIIVISSLLFSRGHYSIDIAGGLMLSYCIKTWLVRWEPRLRLEERSTKT